MKNQIKELKGIIKNDSIEKVAEQRTDLLRDELIVSYRRSEEKNKNELTTSERWRRFWKTCTGVSILGGVGYSVYKEIKE